MTRNYTLQNLGCPNCAVKMEQQIAKLAHVQEASVSYPHKLLRITAEEPDSLLPEIQKICQSVESGVLVVPRDGRAIVESGAHDTEGCCGHDHDHNHEHGHDHSHSHGSSDDAKQPFIKSPLFIGGVLFAVLMIARFFVSTAIPVWGWTALFAVPYLILARDCFREAFQNIRNGDFFDENFLMLIASIGAFCIGEYPEGVAVMLFYRVGEYFEARAVERSRASIMEAVDMRPETVTRIDGNGNESVVAANQIKEGEVIRLIPGERVPLDGTVIDGNSRIDTSPVTGEPVPVSASAGTALISGSININGVLTMRVDKELSESMVTRILQAVENASTNKPKIEKFITRFARIYTPVVSLAAVLLAVVPPLLGMGAWSDWIYRALNFLVVSCPCALVLSVPLAYFAGIGSGSKKGILLKGGNALEALNDIKVVLFDKTGTLTKGDFAVQQILSRGTISESGILALAAAAESHSSHPIAESIRRAADEQGVRPAAVSEVEELAGMGLRAQSEQGEILCGNARLMEDRHVTGFVLDPESMTQVYIALNGEYVGSIGIADAIKSDAKQALAELKSYGMHTAMLTGDNEETAKKIGDELAIDTVRARMMPDQKLSVMQDLREKYGPAMYIGDGINDAPTLAGADVGAAMGTGADAAIEAADIVFMRSQVEAVPQSFRLAKRTRMIAIQNVVFALAVKSIVLILSVFGISNLWVAVFADVGVTLLCVLNVVRVSEGRRKNEI